MCRIYLKRIEHIYFKFDPKVVQQKNVSELFNYCDPTGFTPAKAVTIRLHFWVESSEAFAISISCSNDDSMSCSFESLQGMQIPSFDSVITRPPDLTIFISKLSKLLDPYQLTLSLFRVRSTPRRRLLCRSSTSSASTSTPRTSPTASAPRPSFATSTTTPSTTTGTTRGTSCSCHICRTRSLMPTLSPRLPTTGMK